VATAGAATDGEHTFQPLKVRAADKYVAEVPFLIVLADAGNYSAVGQQERLDRWRVLQRLEVWLDGRWKHFTKTIKTDSSGSVSRSDRFENGGRDVGASFGWRLQSALALCRDVSCHKLVDAGYISQAKFTPTPGKLACVHDGIVSRRSGLILRRSVPILGI